MTIFITSCKSKEEITYFKNIDTETGTINLPTDYQIKVEPNDQLLIQVTSLIPEECAKYNLPPVSTLSRGVTNIPSSNYIMTYTVNPNGEIIFPSIGSIHVAGKTTLEIKEYLTTEISKDVKSPHVDVSLYNFKVNVLGAVNSPGSISVSSERFSILDAIAAANDLALTGKRNNVLLIREIDGKKNFQRIDLTSNDLFKSPYYYLKQNDVIYVEPTMVSRENAQFNTNNSFKLSVISTVVSAASVIASLIIALVAAN